MSTRATIIVQRGSDRYQAVYCHRDGGTDRLGERLVNYYDSTVDAFRLVVMGDLRGVDASNPDPFKEANCEPGDFSTVQAVLQVEKYRQEYVYLHRAGVWYVMVGSAYADGGPRWARLGELRVF